MITRRGALLISSVAILNGRLGFAASEPWKDKKPKNWSESDVRLILKRSPWAKEVRPEFNPELLGEPPDRGGPPGGPPPGGGPGGFPGGGFPSGGPPGGAIPDGGPQSFSQMKLTVRWASARPVKMAAKSNIDDLGDKYVITVSGVPAMAEGAGPRGPISDSSSARERMADRFGAVSTLQIKGRDPINPDHVEILETPEDQTVRLGFPRGQHPIELRDKVVTFSTQVGPAAIKMNFILKDMMFEGKLEL